MEPFSPWSPLSTRTQNVLRRYGIESPAQLEAALDSGEALRWRGFGPVCLREVQAFLRAAASAGCPYCNPRLAPGSVAPINQESQVYGPARYCRQCGRRVR